MGTSDAGDAGGGGREAALRAFVGQYEADAAAGRVPPAEIYAARFPAHADAIREWYARLRAEDEATPVSPPPADSVLGRLLRGEGDRYHAAGEIARGGMGAILRVRDAVLERDLAMKVLLGDEGTVGPTGDGAEGTLVPGASLRRFLQEAHVTAQLSHPGVPPVHSLGVDREGRAFFTMKFVRGRTLAEVFTLVRAGTDGWTLTRALQVFLRVCETMAFAHSREVIHRDLKPPNVMVGKFGEVYVMDWGLARTTGSAAPEDGPGEPAGAGAPGPAVDAAAAPRPPAPPGPADGPDAAPGSRASLRDTEALTEAGSVLGTPYYMSPEQAAGRHDRLDARSDVYSIGAMLYEMLAGTPPYRDPAGPHPHPLVVLAAVRAGPPEPLHRVAPRTPPELEAIVARAMARDPDRRYPSAAELAEDLHRYMDGRVVRAHRTGPLVELRKWVLRHRGEAAGAAAVVALLVLSSVVIAARERSRGAELATERDGALAARAAAESARVAAEGARAAAEAAREEALRQGRRAEGSTLSARALARASQDPTLALQLAVEGASRSPGAEANEALLTTLHAQREVRRLVGHDSYVYGVAWSPDGEGLVSWQWGRLAILWDPAAGRVRHRLDAHDGLVMGAAWSPRGDAVVTASADGTARVWDAATGACVAVLAGHEGGVAAAAFDPSGTRVVTGCDDGPARIFDARTGKCLRVLDGHAGGVWSAVFHPDGQRVLTLGTDGFARMRDVATGAEIYRVAATERTLDPARNFPRPAGRSPASYDRAGFLAGGETFFTWHRSARSEANGGEARLFASADGRAIGRAGDRAHPVRCPVPTPEGDVVVIGEADDGWSPTRFHDARTFEIVRAAVGMCGSQGMDVSPGGRMLAGASLWNPTAHLIAVDAPAARQELRHAYAATGFAFHPDGTRVATTACDRTVRIWWTRDPDVLPASSGRDLRPAADGRTVWTTIQEDGRSTGLVGRDAITGEERWRWRASDGPARAVAVDPRGGAIAFLAETSATVVGAADGREIRRVDGEAWARIPRTASVALGPDGRRLLLREGRRFMVADLEAGRLLHDGLVSQGLDYNALGWDATGSRLVCANNMSRLGTVWDTDSGRLVARLEGHMGHVIDADLSPDGTRAVTVAVDRSVRLWDAATGRALAANRTLPMEECRVMFSPTGDVVAVIPRHTGGVLLLDGGTLDQVSRVPPELDPGTAFWFRADGREFLTRRDDGPLRRWRVDPLPLARERVPCPVDPESRRRFGFFTAEESRAYEEAWHLDRPTPDMLARLGLARLDAGDADAARRLIDAAMAARPRHAHPHHALACWHASRGEVDAALDAIEASLPLEGGLLRPLEEDGRLAPLRDHPRFRAAVQRAAADR